MHRVELKVSQFGFRYRVLHPVPNAPCGVESQLHTEIYREQVMFLMHRVELKAGL